MLEFQMEAISEIWEITTHGNYLISKGTLALLGDFVLPGQKLEGVIYS
jgi:hypothetical protein